MSTMNDENNSTDQQQQQQLLIFNDYDSEEFLNFYKSTQNSNFQNSNGESGTPEIAQTVRFFLRNDTYAVFEEAAKIIARDFYRSQAVLNTLNFTKLQYVSLRRGRFLEVLRDLLVDNARSCVEVYEFVGRSEWKLIQKGSPGRLQDFEEELFGADQLLQVSVVGSIWVESQTQGNLIGVSITDLSNEQKIQSCEFFDDSAFSNLENAILQVGAKEIVAPEISSVQNPKLRQVCEKINVMLVLRPPKFFQQEFVASLQQLLKNKNIQNYREILECKAAKKSLCGLINFADLMTQPTFFGKFSLVNYNPNLYLKLDSAALSALNIVPQQISKYENNNKNNNNTGSLYGLISGKCSTKMGKILLLTWIRQPSVDFQIIIQRQNVVEIFVQNLEVRHALRQEHLRFLPDFGRLIRKLELEKSNLQDLWQLYAASKRLPFIAEVLPEELQEKFSGPLLQFLDDEYLGKFCSLVENALDPGYLPEQFLIQKDYNSNLKQIYENKCSLEKDIDKLSREAAEDLGLELGQKLRLEWHKTAGKKIRCLRITAKDEKQVRQKIKASYIVLESNNDGFRFTNNQFQKVAQKLFEVTCEYENTQQELVIQVVKVAATFGEVWRQVSNILAEIDVLCTFAEIALTCGSEPYVRPKIIDSKIEGGNEIKLLGSRHPLLEMQDEGEFVQNDCCMVNGDSWFLIITGPNMGGKSTYIRQVGMCFVLAQMGSFVPCREAVIPIRDAIYTRVGSRDCQFRGVSTFMAEMLETATIVKNATQHSLVIVDELGRGTSTSDGFGIACAVSEHLVEKLRCPTLFATHFYGLTKLSAKGGVKNVHVHCTVAADTGKPSMLYQVRDGCCDSSFGINVARLVGFPEHVIQDAEQTLNTLEKKAAKNVHEKFPLENIDCNVQEINSKENN